MDAFKDNVNEKKSIRPAEADAMFAKQAVKNKEMENVLKHVIKNGKKVCVYFLFVTKKFFVMQFFEQHQKKKIKLVLAVLLHITGVAIHSNACENYILSKAYIAYFATFSFLLLTAHKMKKRKTCTHKYIQLFRTLEAWKYVCLFLIVLFVFN